MSAKQHQSKTHRNRGFLKQVLSGSALTGHEQAVLRLISFLAILGILYIANTYWGIKTLRKINALKKEQKELAYDYTTARSAWSDSTKQSRLLRRAKAIGLIETPEPPIKITLSQEDIKKLKAYRK
ncbi:MAG: hypothetical protein PWR20_492 [Bacteroidales bacterium]|jgi:hypothetical protein|nr:hypothetical protein [Bacteroidales bacterium]MDN5328964.1 hypothetical protein [Bacteroidales bacterium]